MEQRRCFGCMELTDQPVCPRCGWRVDQDNAPHQLPAGTVLEGKYQVGRVLGQGGFGITYVGWDLNLDIQVCIKEFYPSSTVNRDHRFTSRVNCNTTGMEAGYAASRERFLREAKSLAKFRSVHQIVSIFDFFQDNNTAYIVMEYVEGIDLAKYVYKRGGRIGMNETLRILKPIMEALTVVHKAGMVHRDIAPDNILLHPREGAKLLDFGAVRQVENPDAEKQLTHSTEAILKNGFAPMEQYSSRGSLGPWTDVYALSATIYYCVTGRIPMEATTRVLEGQALDWSGAEGITPRQIRTLERGMAILITDRIQSVGELMTGLYTPEPQPRPEPQSEPEPQLRTIPADYTAKTEPVVNSGSTPPQRKPEPMPQPQFLHDPERKQDPLLKPARIPKPEPKPKLPGSLRLTILGGLTGLTALVVILALLVNAGWHVQGDRYSYYPWYGAKLTDSWYQEDGNYYYFDSDGYMVTGLRSIDGNTYYFSSGGKMRTGWQTINGNTYYFSSGGKMLTGWQTIEGSNYYFGKDGRLVTGR